MDGRTGCGRTLLGRGANDGRAIEGAGREIAGAAGRAIGGAAGRATGGAAGRAAGGGAGRAAGGAPRPCGPPGGAALTDVTDVVVAIANSTAPAAQGNADMINSRVPTNVVSESSPRQWSPQSQRMRKLLLSFPR